ncbi:sensor histidine kinase [Aquimarina sp. 2304DJ70-9]|uniref:sensor histidine kinase n=1 Tax=Aquimarina penaris TaxID=3231044 RepID=UPI003462654C
MENKNLSYSKTALLILIFFQFAIFSSLGQRQVHSELTIKIDSLKSILHTEKLEASKANYMISLSRLYLNYKEYDEKYLDSAKVYADKVIELGEQVKDSNIISKGVVHQAMVLNAAGEYDLAISTLNNLIKELELAYEEKRIDNKITISKVNDNIKNLKTKQKQNFGIGLAVGSFIILFLLIVLLRVLNLKQGVHKTVKEKYEENKLLMKEIHHRVKNNLQIILSLLNAQANSAKGDGKLRMALIESQTKIKSMAIIHQNLYNSNTYTKVRVNDYFEELVEQMRKTFKTAGKVIHFEIEVENKEINMSLAVPLGLIINELVTNSFKYAFDDNRNDNKVNINFKSSEIPDTYRLEIFDNGTGLPKDFDIKTLTSFGMQLVKGLVDQLNGDMKIIDGNGAGFEIYIQEPQAA